MASYILTDIKHDSVTFSVSGITYKTVENEDETIETYDYVNVRFFVRLASDESNETIDEVVTLYGETTITKTFDKLKPLTEYMANVQIYTDHPTDGEWTGAKPFATTERATTAAGTIAEIPVLDSDYPLFSWSDWPDSYAALYEEGQTAEFEKECWNAIIDHLLTALNTGGFAWKDKYMAADMTHITEEYGDLYANAFNSVRHNIDRLAPLGWRWADTPGFHGYIGREDFKGVDEYGNEADDVYYSYIVELVRKMNVLIQIMRGDPNVVRYFSGHQNLISQYRARAWRGIAAHIDFNNESLKSVYRSGVYRGTAAVMRTPRESMISQYRADFFEAVSARLRYMDGLIRSIYFARLKDGTAAVLKRSISSMSDYKVNIRSGIPVFTGYVDQPICSDYINTLFGATGVGLSYIGNPTYSDHIANIFGATGVGVSYIDNPTQSDHMTSVFGATSAQLKRSITTSSAYKLNVMSIMATFIAFTDMLESVGNVSLIGGHSAGLMYKINPVYSDHIANIFGATGASLLHKNDLIYSDHIANIIGATNVGLLHMTDPTYSDHMANMFDAVGVRASHTNRPAYSNYLTDVYEATSAQMKRFIKTSSAYKLNIMDGIPLFTSYIDKPLRSDSIANIFGATGAGLSYIDSSVLSDHTASIFGATGAHMSYIDRPMYAEHIVNAFDAIAAHVSYIDTPARSDYTASVFGAISALLKYSTIMSSAYKLNAQKGMPVFVSYDEVLRSAGGVSPRSGESVPVTGSLIVYSTNNVSPKNGEPVPIQGSELCISTNDVTVRGTTGTSLRLVGRAQSTNIVSPRIAVRAYAEARKHVESTSDIVIRFPEEVLRIKTGAHLESTSDVSARIPEVLSTEAEVHIESTHVANVYEVAGQHPQARTELRSDSSIDFDWAWEPPVWIAPGELLIVQAWDESNLTDGVLEVI